MKRVYLLLCNTVLVLGSLFAQPKIEDELVDLIKRGKYLDLVNKVCREREKEYYKNAFMDYCLAYGYCKLNKASLAQQWIDHILGSYNSLSTKKRRELESLKQSCAAPSATAASTEEMIKFLNSMNPEGFRGNDAGVESKLGIPSLADTVKEFDFEHLTFDSQNRKFTLNQKKEALRYYKNLVTGQSFKVDTTAHFLVFYPAGASAIDRHMKELEEYYNYYNRSFNLNKSNRLITIFYCTSRNDFTTVANLIHKIPVPQSTYGYASSVDLVMLGIANASWLGALKHELFHLMIRSFIGDIPPWLDEGMACYFESSDLNGDRVTTYFSGSNYRFNLLDRMDIVISQVKHEQKQELAIPTIKQLTNYNWQQFSGTTGELMIRASYNQSLGYAFVTYLSEKNLLSKTVEAFRNRSYVDTTSSATQDGLTMLRLKSNDEILENITGINLDAIQLEFKNWCRQKGIDLR